MEHGVLRIPWPNSSKTSLVMFTSELMDGSVSREAWKMTKLIIDNWVAREFSNILLEIMHQRYQYISCQALRHESDLLIGKMNPFSRNYGPSCILNEEVVPCTCLEVQWTTYTLIMIFDNTPMWDQKVNILGFLTTSIGNWKNWGPSQNSQVAVVPVKFIFWKHTIMIHLDIHFKSRAERF